RDDPDVLGVEVDRAGADHVVDDLAGRDAALDRDREPLRAQRLRVELAQHVLLDEVPGADRDGGMSGRWGGGPGCRGIVRAAAPAQHHHADDRKQTSTAWHGAILAAAAATGQVITLLRSIRRT